MTRKACRYLADLSTSRPQRPLTSVTASSTFTIPLALSLTAQYPLNVLLLCMASW